MNAVHKSWIRNGLILAYIWVVSALVVLAADQALRLLGLRAAPTPVLLGLGLPAQLLASAVLGAAFSLLAFRHPRRLLTITLMAALAFTGLNLWTGRHLLPQVLIRPSPVWLAEQYSRALAANDVPAALLLTDGSALCTQLTSEAFQEDRVLLGRTLGGDVRSAGGWSTSVRGITTYYAGQMLQQLAFVMVEAEDGRTAWLTLRLRYGPITGARRICGGHMEPASQAPGG